MGKEKKIKLEHLDETLIRWLEHLVHSGIITFSDLSPELQNSITRGNQGEGSYNDQPIRAEIENLKLNKLNKTDASTEYRRKDTLLSIEDMNDNIKEVLRAVSDVNIAFKRGIRLKSTPISLEDLDGSIRNLIQRYEERISQLENGDVIPSGHESSGTTDTTTPSTGTTDSGLVSSGYNAIKNRINGLSSKYDSIDGKITTNLSKIKELKESIDILKSKIAENTKNITAVERNNIELNNGKISDKLIPDIVVRHQELAILDSKINSIVNKSNPVNGLDGMMGFVSNANLDKIGELQGANLFLAGVFAENTEELTEYKSKKLPVIFSVFEDKMYISTSFIQDNLVNVITSDNRQEPHANYAIYSIVQIMNKLADGQIHSTNEDKNAAEEEDRLNFFTFDYTSGGPLTTHWGLNQKFFLDIKTGYILFNDNGAFINLITGDTNYKTQRSNSTIKTAVDATKAKANGMQLFTSNKFSVSNEPTRVPVANNAVKIIEQAIASNQTYTYKSLGTKPISFELWVKNEESGSEYFNKYIKDDTIAKPAIYVDNAGKQCLDIKNLSAKNINVLIQIYSEV